MLREDYDIEKFRLVNMKSYKSCPNISWGIGCGHQPYLVLQYVLSEHLANAKHPAGTKGLPKPVGQRG